ncbi:MAG: lipid asymmetry maintenance protein MlaB [Legionellales bacterium]
MDATPFKPGSELTFKSVVSVRANLFKALMAGSNQEFCLDLSEVKLCDSAGLALLIEASKLCKRTNKVLKVTGISSATQSLAEFCGVKSILVS